MWILRNIHARISALESGSVSGESLTALRSVVDDNAKALNELRATLERNERAVEAQAKLTQETRLAVSVGIQDVARAENRIKSTIARARAELKKRGLSHAGLEAEVAELRLVNGEGSEDGEVREVSENVESAAPPRRKIPGVPGTF